MKGWAPPLRSKMLAPEAILHKIKHVTVKLIMRLLIVGGATVPPCSYSTGLGWGTDFASANVQVGQNHKISVASQKPLVLLKQGSVFELVI